MAGVNKAIIVGNLGRDPEYRVTEGGQPVCKLAVATTRTWKNKQTDEHQEETEWHRITVWGKQAEHCNNFLSKGRQVYVEGRLRTSSYEQDGVKKFSTEIVAETVQFLGGRQDNQGGGQGDGQGGNSGQSGYNQQAQTSAPAQSSASDVDDDDDIPF